jgi:cystathionine gamma-lyase/cystathionine beta-lyase/cystathionine gamma-lyase/homocysteine desulfhydrase
MKQPSVKRFSQRPKPNTQVPGFSTRAIHDGQEPDPATGAVSVPIYATSTYVQDELGKPRQGYEYARVSNPTRDRLETNLASLESGVASRVFASGMAAINAICTMYKSGDHVVCGHNLYGGVPRLFDQVLSGYGFEFTYVDTSDPKNVERAMRKNTRMVYVETPTNPLMALSDIAAIAKVCRSNVELVVDNTFMSPYFQQPIALGADMVVHSTTKFLNGHSDGLGGVVVCTRKDQAEQLGFVQKAAGAILSPFECWLVLRGTKTLAVRMLQHDSNGRQVADFLARHKKVKKVFYPGLKNHPQHELAKRQMSGFGSMITIETGSLANAARMLKRVRVCTLGESLGGVETLISHPATMTHAALGEKGRAAIGITDGMVRISVGIEDVEDIIRDLNQALA